MTDPSTTEPMVKWSEPWWATRSPEVAARRCKRIKKDGNRCGKVSMEGQRICGSHGGRAPQSKAKARQRLEEAADRMAKQLLKIATDDDVNDATKLKAITEVLDRIGVSARTVVDVEVALKPWEQVMEEVAGTVVAGSRAEYRASIGQPEPIAPALAGQPVETHSDPDGYLVAEVVDPNGGEDLIAAMAYGHVNGEHQADTPDDAEHWLTGDAAPVARDAGGMTLEEANAEALRLRRNAPPMRPPAGLRALPPGRSTR